MSENQFDCIIIGGGLAGGLIALALHRARPELRLALIEAGETLGGNHRWSWFDSDLTRAGRDLLNALPHTKWDDGYEVIFPQYRRHLHTPYRSLNSRDYHQALIECLPEKSVLLDSKAVQISRDSVTLDNGKRLDARIVLDCRNFTPNEHLRGGWQLFEGRLLRLEQPHSIKFPIIMDANLDQLPPREKAGQEDGSYRFVYTLPISDRELFIEDTYYSAHPDFDSQSLGNRVRDYARQLGSDENAVEGQERGALPVLTGGDFVAYQASLAIPGVAIAGARGGFSHPMTSYTVPMAVKNALFIADAISTNPELTGPQLADAMAKRARAHWRRTTFYRMLARMLFFAAEPSKRVDIFQHFYRLSPALIERFYAARSTALDKMRILSGKPPVSVLKAIPALFKKGDRLITDRTDTPLRSNRHDH